MKILSLFWCFILTIWNVNTGKLEGVWTLEESFILTIWNVNRSWNDKYRIGWIVLY
ncbi:TPA: hypothetical protein KPB98_004059 [Clostridioides difficile]|nr:hypothetical protein QCA_1628 [Clostridioides difficile CD40]EQK80499.1 hypothetical protein QE7_1451 [Clostridioides difficile CD92]HAT4852025.1 hypothetical protein [Clostridioides difficile]HBK3257893.1 hypothetical protein [Clostridioides difficile]